MTTPGTTLRILSDSYFDQTTTDRLQQGIAPHELAFPTAGGADSVLASPLYSLADVDVAFGQPDATAVLASETLRWVHLTSAGYTRYDTPEFRAAAEARGLILTNSSSVYAEPCAEHVMAFLLAAARQLPGGLRTLCKTGSPEWNRLRGDCRVLRGQTVLILGYGAIANHLVKRLAPFGMRIVAFRRQPRGNEEVRIVTLAGLPEALAAADHVINVLPDNADTRHFINEGRFACMRRTPLLYNIGRGTTVDQTALAAALRAGRLTGAWLDVTDPEPLPPEHPLLGLENCHITPHIAGGQQDESQNLVRHFLDNLRLFLEGSPLQDRIL
jgi:phosphoglycerate dehydrogenase-like enzyme